MFFMCVVFRDEASAYCNFMYWFCISPVCTRAYACTLCYSQVGTEEVRRMTEQFSSMRHIHIKHVQICPDEITVLTQPRVLRACLDIARVAPGSPTILDIENFNYTEEVRVFTLYRRLPTCVSPACLPACIVVARADYVALPTQHVTTHVGGLA